MARKGLENLWDYRHLVLKRGCCVELVQYQFSANLHNLWEIQWQLECLEREMNWHDMHWGYPFMLDLIKYSSRDFLSAKCNLLSMYTGYCCSTYGTCTRFPAMKSQNDSICQFTSIQCTKLGRSNSSILAPGCIKDYSLQATWHVVNMWNPLVWVSDLPYCQKILLSFLLHENHQQTNVWNLIS